MTDIAFRPAGELTAAIRKPEVSSRDLLPGASCRKVMG